MSIINGVIAGYRILLLTGLNAEPEAVLGPIDYGRAKTVWNNRIRLAAERGIIKNFQFGQLFIPWLRSVALFDWQRQQFIYVSRAYATVWGRSPESLCRNYEEWLASVYPSDMAAVSNFFERILKTRSVNIWEYRIVRPDNQVRWISNRGSAIVDDNGDITRIVGIAEDITERKATLKALRQNEELLRLFVENTPAAVAMCDRQMCYLAHSRRWILDYNLKDEDLFGKCHYDVFQTIPPAWKEEHQRCFRGEIFDHDVEPFTRADGSIDLVILDMIMPDMSGGETFDALKKLDPQVKTLLSSGYSIDGHATDILKRGCNGFIQKPFSLEKLSHKVREVLACREI